MAKTIFEQTIQELDAIDAALAKIDQKTYRLEGSYEEMENRLKAFNKRISCFNEVKMK